ncbi:MAG: NUDIX hydrolase [Magnetococcales bacterium]|nr:NUDIX hydrolase [Magnetococcales bacterium]
MNMVPDYFYGQSSVIPVRLVEGKVEVMVISSRKNKRWVVPKGVVEPELTPQESASKEALEEAGITGLVLRESIGAFSYVKWGGVCSVQVYVMLVEEERVDWLESFRTRRWVSLQEAANLMVEPEMNAIIHAVPAFLKNHGVHHHH